MYVEYLSACVSATILPNMYNDDSVEFCCNSLSRALLFVVFHRSQTVKDVVSRGKCLVKCVFVCLFKMQDRSIVLRRFLPVVTKALFFVAALRYYILTCSNIIV